MPFIGGPLDGQPVDPGTLDQAHQGGMLDLAALAGGAGAGAGVGAGMGPGMGAAPPPPDPQSGPPNVSSSDSGSLSDADRLDRILSDMLAVAGGGDLTEQDKARIQKAMTIVQDIKAAEEKDKHAALGGKLSPTMMAKAYGG